MNLDEMTITELEKELQRLDLERLAIREHALEVKKVIDRKTLIGKLSEGELNTLRQLIAPVGVESEATVGQVGQVITK